jgi:hypothetical protein
MTTQGGMRWLRHIGAVALVVALLPVAIGSSVWHAIRGGADTTPEEFAKILRGASEGGSPSDVYWDELDCVNLRDARLEAIRHEASKVSLPVTPEGRVRLMQLAEEAEALAPRRPS